jgi:hypothetical protein
VVDDPDRWKALTREALDIYRQGTNHYGMTDCLVNLGLFQGMWDGDDQAARDLFEEGLH